MALQVFITPLLQQNKGKTRIIHFAFCLHLKKRFKSHKIFGLLVKFDQI